MHTPGLVVVMPATPYDAKGLLKSAIREDNPVVFLEKRLLYGRLGPGAGDGVRGADRRRRRQARRHRRHGRRRRRGVPLALQAARQLAREGIEIEVIDVRTLKPLDPDAIAGRSRRPAGSSSSTRARSPAASPARSSRAWSKRSASARSRDAGARDGEGHADAVRGRARARGAADGRRSRRRRQGRARARRQDVPPTTEDRT